MHLILLSLFQLILVSGKFLEGTLKTNEDWAFLARFCFLSDHGQFEYYLEFNEELGVPNLLLYYDTEDQWPAVYKTDKTCPEKEAVLHLDQNQIINLTAYHRFYKDLSGCTYETIDKKRNVSTTGTTPRPKYRLNLPTLFTKKMPDINTTDDYDDDDDDDDNIVENITTVVPPIAKRSVLPYLGVGYRKIICRNSRRFKSTRERWWFIAISNCYGRKNKGINIKYRLWMTNGVPGDYWHEQFSADEFYILPVLMSSSLAYAFLMLAIFICTLELKSRQLLHSTYKIFVTSVVVQLFGILFSTIAALKYATQGWGGTGPRRLGAILMSTSEILFLLLALLVAKGYTITRARLPLGASVKLTIFMCLYTITYLALFFYEAQVFDPGEVLYTYESPAGYGLITLRIIAWGMFLYSIIFTVKHHPIKSLFYYPFSLCGTIWFLAGPIFILITNNYVDKWVRESVVCAVLQIICLVGHLSFLVLTAPSLANKNFPYHVRTSQIGVLEDDSNLYNSTNRLMVIPPSASNTSGDLVVPLTRRTEEIFEGIYPSVQLNRNLTPTTIPHNNNHDDGVVLDNVRNWSLVKNHKSEVLSSTKQKKRQINKLEVQHQKDSKKFDLELNNGTDGVPVRDVPIQLFTVSKMLNFK